MPSACLARDPRGRDIRLDAERWAHILDGHPELRDLRSEVLRAVESPTEIMAGRMADEEWFYLEGAGAQSLAQGGRGLRPAE